MSKVDLIQIISSFPECQLEEIIFSSVREIFFSGDWGTANAMIEHILKSGVKDNLKMRIAGLGIFVAVRARNIKQALDRYRYLEMLDASNNLLYLKANGLLDLSDLLLPDHVSLLFELWQKAIRAGLPKTIQKKYAKLGALLCEQFLKNGDNQKVDEIISLMSRNLDSGIRNKNCWQTDKS